MEGLCLGPSSPRIHRSSHRQKASQAISRVGQAQARGWDSACPISLQGRAGPLSLRWSPEPHSSSHVTPTGEVHPFYPP